MAIGERTARRLFMVQRADDNNKLLISTRAPQRRKGSREDAEILADDCTTPTRSYSRLRSKAAAAEWSREEHRGFARLLVAKARWLKVAVRRL